MKKILFSFVITISLFAFHSSVMSQDHGHFYVGATGKNQGDQLIIKNADDFSRNTDYVKTLTFTNGGRYAGYFHGNITFEALPSTNALGDAVPGGAALGSWIHAQITSVDGPEGGVFSFWENGATAPTLNVPSGTTSTTLWVISNNNGAPETDPFGHIHGRRFTATKPGIYTVGFQAVDRSVNGLGGGPIHTDTDVLQVYFQAGINIASLERSGGTNSIRFGGMLNRTFHLEHKGDFSMTNWTTIESVVGQDFFTMLQHTNSLSQGFYRIRESSP